MDSVKHTTGLNATCLPWCTKKGLVSQFLVNWTKPDEPLVIEIVIGVPQRHKSISSLRLPKKNRNANGIPATEFLSGFAALRSILPRKM